MRKTLTRILRFGAFVAVWFSLNPAQAQSYLSPGYILGEIREGMGFYSMPNAPDFVVKARPDPSSLEYVPLKPPPKDLHNEAATPQKRIEAEVGNIAELEAARARTQARAGSAGKIASKKPVLPEENPPPMKWNPWDTE